MVNYMAVELEKKKKHYSCGLLSDVSQAFDRVWTEVFFTELNTYYHIFKLFISDQFFTVSEGSSISDYFPINAGDPHDSFLVLILFGIYTSDIPNSLRILTNGFFANDTVIILLMIARFMIPTTFNNSYLNSSLG